MNEAVWCTPTGRPCRSPSSSSAASPRLLDVIDSARRRSGLHRQLVGPDYAFRLLHAAHPACGVDWGPLNLAQIVIATPPGSSVLPSDSTSSSADATDRSIRPAALSNTGGLRERHKADKLQRISAAATRLFSTDGYEGTTLRDIANEAGVALGTLSLYGRDKRDLVLLIFNRVIPPLMQQGYDNAAPSARLSDNMVAFFVPFYRAYVNEITLYRIVLSQVYGSSTGSASRHAVENDHTLLKLLGLLENIIRFGIETGEIRSHVDVSTQARSFFYLYFAAVRVWLFQESPGLHDGLIALRILFEQHVLGLVCVAPRP